MTSGQPDLYIEWSPDAIKERRGVPGGGGWRTLDQYAAHLQGLGLSDPTRAAALRVAAEHVRDAAIHDPVGGAAPSVVDRVASGSMSPKKALEEMARRPDPEDAQKLAARQQRDVEELTADLLHRAAVAIHDYGDRWLDVLKPIAADAVKNSDEDKWRRAHEFGAWLRDPKWVRVCALSAAMLNENDDADPWVYQYGDSGRGLHRWRVEHAGVGQWTPGTPLITPSGTRRMAFSLSPNAPMPTIADIRAHADEWGGAGLFSASEAIANMHRALAAQDREIALLMGEPPPTRRRVMAV